VKKERNVDNYKRELDCFSDEVQEWLIDTFLEHGNCINRLVVNYLKYRPEYFLAVSDDDYRAVAKDIFEDLIKRFPYLNESLDLLFELFKQAHKKLAHWSDVEIGDISEPFNNWIDEAKNKYGVDIVKFANAYHTWWCKSEKLWERKCKAWNKEWEQNIYDWRHAQNPFGLNEFCSNYKHLLFIDGNKHNLEMLLIYIDCHGWGVTWQKLALKDYISKFLKRGMSVIYKEATARELGVRWEYLISENKEDDRWKIWKDEFINGNIEGTMQTFIALQDRKIVGEATYMHKNSEIRALRVNPKYQGHGVATGLIKCIEEWASKNKITCLIIGVEPSEVRNMQIYFHWGFTEFVSSENGVLYYRKKLSPLS